MSDNNDMNMAELQQIVSACLDLIESLKKENEDLKNTLSLCAKTIRENQEFNNRTFGSFEHAYLKNNCKIAFLNNRQKHLMSGVEKGVLTHTPFNGNGVVYSVVTGKYDDIIEIEVKNPELKYIMFTDDADLRSDTWEVRYLPRVEGLDSARLSRRPKILAHEYLSEFDYSIYVDANMIIRGDLMEYVKTYRSSSPVLCCMHYSNDCIYDEAKACISLNKDDPERIIRQVEFLRSEGYPAHNGLIAGGFLVREHNDPKVISIMNTWWDMVVNYSRRDQLSFDYACWKNDFLYDASDTLICENEYVMIRDTH